MLQKIAGQLITENWCLLKSIKSLFLIQELEKNAQKMLRMLQTSTFLEYVGYTLEISNVSIRVQASIFRYVLLGRFVG